ncbi:S1C family serine protease [Limosilactobacillus albertensis]|uniref:Trypsin-like peptidase domain-containing protein n=1 Tax=Limosilactobacillus albertensis TaxID=2759752 RepID=A0A839H0W1_9LACO|nr:trypsin-like peptidase domain-containing protein [Limosilactobacillus albertensis]MBB1124225.1 trypsin-like peptidase domain-containing protein [Limosilactobacillus albertensis]MBC8743819.1 trypsin-like peptidase domain-containing protein [Lactobacillus sp. Marseille-P7033]MCD7121982.1 trypsin-like peptidase domain-containing protein [Limosilactobacillus albertensis]NGC78442.1 PDZ domain-containing protein [Limosilactobacillus reuteri]
MKKIKQAFKDRLWLGVIVVGLLAGLIGGGIALGINNLVQHHEEVASTRVPTGSNKSGGTKVNKNKADLNGEASQAYKSVQGAVVSVINKQKVQQSNGTLGIFGYGNSSANGSSSSSSSDNKLETASEGSGVIYKKSGDSAYVVTNNHVVKGSNALQVILSNGKKVNADLVGADSATDLAVLKINAKNVKTIASFGNSNSIVPGQDVLAIGSPMGSEYANTVTKGIISAKDRTLKAGTDGTLTSVIQTDAAINSGNSGGPLINMAGQVIGINSMKLSSDTQGSSVEGIGFAIPSNEVVTIINQLIKNGKITRPSLGISMVDLSNVTSDQQQSVLKLPTSVSKGVVIMDVNSGSVADTAGLKKYDVITKLGDTQITDTGSLKAALYKYKVGETAKVTYYHDGQEHTATLHLTKSADTTSTDDSQQENN